MVILVLLLSLLAATVAEAAPTVAATSSTGNLSGGSTTVAVAVPTGSTTNDLLVACVAAFSDDLNNVTATGWTHVATNVNVGNGTKIAMLWKPWDSGDSGTYTFTVAAVSVTSRRGLIFRIAGADLVTPSAATVATTSGFSTARSYASMTTTEATTLGLGCMHWGQSNTTYTQEGSLTQNVIMERLAGDSKAIATASATGVLTGSGTNTAWGSILWSVASQPTLTNPYQATVNWVATGQNPIINRVSQCGSTILASTFGGGVTDATSTINSAIAACGTNQFVLLGPGHFRVDGPITLTKSNVTLRGSGMFITNIEKHNWQTNNRQNVTLGSNEFSAHDETTAVNLTVDAVAGDYTITVSNAVGYAAGQFIKIDSDEWATAGWLTAAPLKDGTPYQIWGTDRCRIKLRNPDNANLPTTPKDTLPPTGKPGSLGDYSREDRLTTETKEIVSVVADGVGGAPDTITFSLPLMIDFPVSKASQVVRFTGANVHIQYTGIEDLSLIGGNSAGVRVTTCAYCWIKGVEIREFESPGVDTFEVYRLTVRDSYIHHTHLPVPGGGGYAFSVRDGGSNTHFTNNIVVNVNKVSVGRAAGSGSVVSYNYMQDSMINYDLTFMEVGINASHFGCPHHWLFEGNQSSNYDSDFTFGTSSYMTVFKNWLEGERRTLPTIIGRSYRAAGLMEQSLWHAFYGNIIGRPVFVEPESKWMYDDPCDGSGTTGAIACTVSMAAIWRTGYSSINAQTKDPWVASTLIRMGNWDYLTDSQQWHDGAAQPLPDSLYLSAKPDFFPAGYVWPWVNPATGVTYILPAKERYEAITQQNDYRYQLRFRK